MLLVAGAAALSLFLGGTVASASGATWTETRLPGPARELFLLNVSCPSASLCVATGTQNLIASSTDPTGGPGAWRVVYAGEGRYEGPNNFPVISNRQVQGVSCPTVHLCVAVTTLGQIYATTDPTGPASSWKVTEVPSTGGNTHLYGVSCPSVSLCVAVSGRRVNAGKVFTSTDPTGGMAAWQVTELGESFDLRAVSCSSPTLCVAAGANGELVASTDPTGGALAWSRLGTPAGPGQLQGISCVSGLCLSGNESGNLLTSGNPLVPSSWQETSGGSSVAITGASCASSSACVAVDVNGHVLTSTNPTAGSSAWNSTVLVPYSPEVEEFDPQNPNALFGASCPSNSLCALVGSGGQIFTSTDPFGPSPSTHSSTAGRSRGPRRPNTRFAKLVLPSPREVEERRAHVFARFYASGPVRRFECAVDRHRFHSCHSPLRFKVGKGTYMLRVRAVGLSGLRGPVARKRFWVGRRCTGAGHHRRCLGGSGELPLKRRG
jgi:hypothetical protein